MSTRLFSLPTRWQQFHALTKPRVIQLIVFCALIGMVLGNAYMTSRKDRLVSRSSATLPRSKGFDWMSESTEKPPLNEFCWMILMIFSVTTGDLGVHMVSG